jgi:Protein of unknown function (DUF2752)
MIPCLFKTLFGIECLGCGLQRAIALMLKGDFIKAFHMYPAVYLVLLFIGMMILNILSKRKNYTKSLTTTGVLTWIFILGGYICKNL